jgi:cytochrome c oxidase subunit 2
MVLPNIVSYAQARFDKPGVYNILCHEYCGVNHHQMRAGVEVTESSAPTRASP